MYQTDSHDPSFQIALETELWEQLMIPLDTEIDDEVSLDSVEVERPHPSAALKTESVIFEKDSPKIASKTTIIDLPHVPVAHHVKAHASDPKPIIHKIGKFEVVYKHETPVSIPAPVATIQPSSTPEVAPTAALIQTLPTEVFVKKETPVDAPTYHPSTVVIPRHLRRMTPSPRIPTYPRPFLEKKSDASTQIVASPQTKQPIQWLHKPIIATGITTMLIALLMLTKAILPSAEAEASYQLSSLKNRIITADNKPMPTLPTAVPLKFDPLITDAGEKITPIDTDFGIVVPKIGINASVIPSVDPKNQKEYDDALLHGVAHASTSFYPNENGVTYLFSHSTNYEWYIKDLNAIFYNLKNLEKGDIIVLIYKGKRYTYQLREKKIVSPKDTSLLSPIYGTKMLILETCWPPGSTTQRLLVIADFVEEAKLEI